MLFFRSFLIQKVFVTIRSLWKFQLLLKYFFNELFVWCLNFKFHPHWLPINFVKNCTCLIMMHITSISHEWPHKYARFSLLNDHSFSSQQKSYLCFIFCSTHCSNYLSIANWALRLHKKIFSNMSELVQWCIAYMGFISCTALDTFFNAS